MDNLIVSAHQPSYIPYLGYVHKLIISDLFIIMDNVQYEKNGYTNRNMIKTSNGPIWLTVPIILKNHTNKIIKDMEINNSSDWKLSHWKSIYYNYKKANFFNHYSDFLENLYKQKWEKLTDITNYILRFIIKDLEISTKIEFLSDTNIKGKKDELILNMCKKYNANIFIFGSSGKTYADQEKFSKEKINLYFQEYKHPTYNQLWGDFISNMSIIDLLLNEGPKKSKNIILRNNINKEDFKNVKQ